MADALSKTFDLPDDVVEFPNIRTSIVELGDLTVGRLVSQPGWRWSKDVFESARGELERFGGREVQTTGGGILATSEGPARALHCASAVRRRADSAGLQIRAGVHVGEVEPVGADVRGVAVHEAARIMAAAGAGEILVSDLTRALAGASGLLFEDRGTHAPKGLDGEWHLCAFASEGSS